MTSQIGWVRFAISLHLRNQEETPYSRSPEGRGRRSRRSRFFCGEMKISQPVPQVEARRGFPCPWHGAARHPFSVPAALESDPDPPNEIT
jgi:hypothetical protein